ncbi:hypothetical protein, partial [Ruegeria sediminis]|uniref:hypothetical protein n=1 Tax=Ruegeria sediminis TaxID=2583820 RepID=UPI001485D2FB
RPARIKQRPRLSQNHRCRRLSSVSTRPLNPTSNTAAPPVRGYLRTHDDRRNPNFKKIANFPPKPNKTKSNQYFTQQTQPPDIPKTPHKHTGITSRNTSANKDPHSRNRKQA